MYLPFVLILRFYLDRHAFIALIIFIIHNWLASLHVIIALYYYGYHNTHSSLTSSKLFTTYNNHPSSFVLFFRTTPPPSTIMRTARTMTTTTMTTTTLILTLSFYDSPQWARNDHLLFSFPASFLLLIVTSGVLHYSHCLSRALPHSLFLLINIYSLLQWPLATIFLLH